MTAIPTVTPIAIPAIVLFASPPLLGTGKPDGKVGDGDADVGTAGDVTVEAGCGSAVWNDELVAVVSSTIMICIWYILLTWGASELIFQAVLSTENGATQPN